jgi:hypothetical protein
MTHEPFSLRPTRPRSAARRGNDSTNNVEVVVAAPKAGAWTAVVRATSVPMGPQAYTIVTPSSALRDLPTVDACERNESCPGACALPAFRLLRPFDRRVAEDFSTIEEALETWSTRHDELTLHRSLTALDRDFFRVTLPSAGGRPGSGAPVLECGTVIRQAHGAFGGTTTDRVIFWGGAYIQALRADGGHLIDEPVDVQGGLSTHRSLAREVVVDCPQTKRAREICFAVGDRPPGDPRERFHSYRLLVDYRIEAQRVSGRFEWLRELIDDLAEAERVVTLLPCPGGVFPDCPRLVDWFEVVPGPRLLRTAVPMARAARCSTSSNGPRRRSWT